MTLEVFQLSNYSVSSVPSGSQKYMRQTDHLKMNGKVAITLQGLKDHNEHKMLTKVGIGASLGLVALPVLGVTGGLGLAMGGEAIGISLAELTVVSTMATTGAGVGIHNATKVTGHRVTRDSLELMNMVGVFIKRRARWFDQEGYDVLIEWKSFDAWGEIKTTKSWHNPGDLVGITYKD